MKAGTRCIPLELQTPTTSVACKCRTAPVFTFTTIFPACYSGRWPHIHFEVYTNLDNATGGGEPIATSQVALPEAACNEVFATEGYDQSVDNLAQTSLGRDMVFGDDGGVRELATMTGNITDGYTIALTVPV